MVDEKLKLQLNKLVALQKIDFDLFSLKRDLADKPALIDELKTQFEQSKSKLKSLEDKLKNILVKRKETELEVKEKEDGISKAKAQLNLLKTNKEYSAKLAEIESLKADQSLFEEKILISFDEGDAVSKDIEKEKVSVGAIEKDFLAKKKIFEDEIKAIEEKIRSLEGQRASIAPEVDRNFLIRYEKIVNHKDGLGIVPVKQNTCGGCNMNVPNQLINELKLSTELIYCGICSRILYLEEDL